MVLHVSSDVARDVTMHVSDLLGREVRDTRAVELVAGASMLPLSTAALRPGVYMLLIHADDGTTMRQRLLIR